MSAPNGCDWWTGQRMKMYKRKVCPCCKGTANDHLNRAIAAMVKAMGGTAVHINGPDHPPIPPINFGEVVQKYGLQGTRGAVPPIPKADVAPASGAHVQRVVGCDEKHTGDKS